MLQALIRVARALGCVLVPLALSACGFDKSGLGAPEGLGPTDDGAVSGDTGSDPVTVHGDPYPKGAVSFFKREACPAEWTPYEPAVGRTVVPTIGENPPGGVNGDPLVSGEDRAHTHKWTAAIPVSGFSLATIDGDNDGVGNAGNLPFAGATEPASTGLPYVQLLACKKVGARGPKALPSGMQVFFDAPKCPAGFHQTEETQGRVVVGLPKGAGADQTFGAAPMFGSAGREHLHGLTATLVTNSYGLLVVSSCCRDGYARNGSYPVTAKTEPSAAGLPWVELLSCSKD